MSYARKYVYSRADIGFDLNFARLRCRVVSRDCGKRKCESPRGEVETELRSAHHCYLCLQQMSLRGTLSGEEGLCTMNFVRTGSRRGSRLWGWMSGQGCDAAVET
jgi:hypothetical protein